MFRLLQVTYSKPVPATSVADVELKTGMGVVYDIATDTVELPSAETADNIFFVDKERIATGRNAAVTNLSDYEPEFNTITASDRCQRYKGYVGERFAVDQYHTSVTTATVGDFMAVGTDGLWTIASGATRYEFGGMYDDAGHALAIIEVLE